MAASLLVDAAVNCGWQRKSQRDWLLLGIGRIAQRRVTNRWRSLRGRRTAALSIRNDIENLLFLFMQELAERSEHEPIKPDE